MADDRTGSGGTGRLLVAAAVAAALGAIAWRTLDRPIQEPAPERTPAAPAPPADRAPRLWTDPGAVSSVAAVDVDGNGRSDVVLCCAVVGVRALSAADGSPVWSFETKSSTTPPAIADLDGDRRADVLVGTKDGRVIALAANGNVLWVHCVHDEVFQVACADIDGDGTADALVAFERGVKAISGRTASQIALLEYPRKGSSRVVPADLDADGVVDWIANYQETEFHTRGVSGRDGSTLWTRQTGKEPLSPPGIGDFDGDGKLDVVYASETTGAVWAFQGAKGREIGRWSAEGIAPHAPESVNLGGIPGVLVTGGRETGWVKAISARDGRVVWSFATGDTARFAPLVIEAGNRCVVADGATGLAVLSVRDGSVEARLDLGSRVTSRPAAGDLDGDGGIDVVAATADGVVAHRVPRE